MKRSMLNKDLQKTVEFIVEQRKRPEDASMIVDSKPVNFTITPESLQNVKDVSIRNLFIHPSIHPSIQRAIIIYAYVFFLFFYPEIQNSSF